jgi:hypothetical protein
VAKAAKFGGVVFVAAITLGAVMMSRSDDEAALALPLPRPVAFVPGAAVPGTPAEAMFFEATLRPGRGAFLTVTETVETQTEVETFEWHVLIRHRPAIFRVGIWAAADDPDWPVRMLYPEHLQRARGVLGAVRSDGDTVSWVLNDPATGAEIRRHTFTAIAETEADLQRRRPKFSGFKPAPWWQRWLPEIDFDRERMGSVPRTAP